MGGSAKRIAIINVVQMRIVAEILRGAAIATLREATVLCGTQFALLGFGAGVRFGKGAAHRRIDRTLRANRIYKVYT